ncbi:GDSL-type esterase/lipase family protein [Curtobacterium ammoniigenes]|uniref:GDSL-type esterase/lipase family protein n=1 Tax=Curtobacterium ammoniigenes TaxID=395387 RepID=UPI0008311FB9|nr:GDSL-type esterase/lipase family protein [Curtobacterium ammoniigenes]
MTDDSERELVAFLGASIVAAGDWESWLPGERVLNMGIPGDTTDAVLARLASVVAAAPNVIVLLIGTNDFMEAKASVEHVVRNIETILVDLRRDLPGVRLLLVSITPGSDAIAAKITEANRHLRQFVATCHAQFLDLWPALAEGDHLKTALTEDGIHLNADGYRAWVDELIPGLERLRGLPPMSRPMTAIDLGDLAS